MTQLIERLLLNGRKLLIVGLASLALAACGGDDGGGGGPIDSGPPADVDDGTGGDNGGDDNGNDDTGDDTGDDADDGSDDGPPADDDTGLVFDTFQAASLVIGQQDLTGGEPNQGAGSADANTLDNPMGHVVFGADAGVMFVADAANSRVLGYDGLPETNNANAAFVLGQPDFTTTERTTISAADMYSPEWITVMQDRLAVTDTDLNRVTIYDGVPTSGSALPTLVIGQESLDTFEGDCDADTLIHPHAHLLLDDGRVVVADAGNNRVLVWNEMPTENGADADFVLGQTAFTNCSNLEPGNFQHPASMWSDGETLIVADSEKHRVLIWNTFPTESFQAPDVILGQSDMDHSAPNDDDQDGTVDGEFEAVTGPDGIVSLTENGDATARTLNYPRDVDVHDGKLYVADMDNHRVLVWNGIPTENFAPADNVLGQPDFTSNEPNAGEDSTNAQGFERPVGLSVIDNKLYVTDWMNSRVMVFDGETS